MANGIDWFRWHHGSVTDPKFALVARKSNARLGDVIAVWAYLLEAASASTDRGGFGQIDCEAVDFLLGLDDGATEVILAAMDVRGLIHGNGIVSWEKRQPKREDETAAERKRRQREREHELQTAACVTSSESRTVTHCHDREEERREEEIKEPKTKAARERAAPLPCPDGVTDETWRDWLALRKAKRAPVNATVIREAQGESVKAGLSFDAFLRVWCGRGSQGLSAEWLKPHERGSPKEAISKWIKGTSLDPNFQGYPDDGVGGIYGNAPALR